jgi:hypothetical protein
MSQTPRLLNTCLQDTGNSSPQHLKRIPPRIEHSPSLTRHCASPHCSGSLSNIDTRRNKNNHLIQQDTEKSESNRLHPPTIHILQESKHTKGDEDTRHSFH